MAGHNALPFVIGVYLLRYIHSTGHSYMNRKRYIHMQVIFVQTLAFPWRLDVLHCMFIDGEFTSVCALCLSAITSEFQ